jgi:hypothetical protein
MFVLYTSDFSGRYLQDVLDGLGYPNGHVVCFRYDLAHVVPTIAGWVRRHDGTVCIPRNIDREAVIVYAERTTGEPTARFNFFPFRLAKILHIRKIGCAFYINLQLVGFPAYTSEKKEQDSRLKKYREAIQAIPMHPLPPLTKEGKGFAWYNGTEVKDYIQGQGGKSGYFLQFLDTTKGQELFTGTSSDISTDDQEAWESVVEVLGPSREFSKCTFFRIANVRCPSRSWFFRSWYESKSIAGKPQHFESEYAVPAGDYVLMSLRSYRPKSSNEKPDRTIRITAKGDGFVLASPEDVFIDSRYNDQRVILASKRILDATVSPVVFSIAPGENTADTEQMRVVAPRIQLLLRVQPPRRTIIAVFTCFLIGSLVLSLGPDAWDKILNAISTSSEVTKVLKGFPAELSMASKLIGSFVLAAGAYFGFRRLPLRS